VVYVGCCMLVKVAVWVPRWLYVALAQALREQAPAIGGARWAVGMHMVAYELQQMNVYVVFRMAILDSWS
jgi:hypothetical protein